MINRSDISKIDLKYLKLLAKKFPTIQQVSSEIINLRAILGLPKGTEHFMSDLHGEHEAFAHILNSASGVIREKIDMVYGETLSENDRAMLATLIYYPQQKLELIKRENPDMRTWYLETLKQLIEICRWVSSKYTRSKVRKALPLDFAYIIDELLHANYDAKNKESYYRRIMETIIEIDRADFFIVALATLIKQLAVDKLHIVGDIFDRGPRADIIMDLLIKHHSVDIQWGNHDILWLGAASGSEACIANVINISLQYSNLDMIERGYGISLRHLVAFAQDAYDDGKYFTPKREDDYNNTESYVNLQSKLHKAIVVILFKLEGETILRNPRFKMEERLLLDKINYETKTITLSGKEYPLKDCDFPTIDPANPYELTEAEKLVVDSLKTSFLTSEKLQEHARFLYSVGSLYKCYNSNLLFHACIPLDDDGNFTRIEVDGELLKGKSLMDRAELRARNAYFSDEGTEEKRLGEDFMWYLWCGKNSPLFGRDRMTTFERLLIADKSTWEEDKNPYYKYINDEATCRKILVEFGLDPDKSHIMNGHVPVKIKDGESPIKANGKLIVIDGGFCRAYQPTTGIAGYTLIYNSYGLRLISHEPFSSTREAIEQNTEISSTSSIFEVSEMRQRVSETDHGIDIKDQIDSLKLLLVAYRNGIIKELEK